MPRRSGPRVAVDARSNSVRVLNPHRCPETREYARLLGRLAGGGARELPHLLSSGITMEYFAKDPVDGLPMPDVAHALFCSVFASGRPDHDQLLAFASGAIGDCVLPACRMAEASLAKKVIRLVRARGITVRIRASIASMVHRPDGITPEEVHSLFPGHEHFAYSQLLDSGRFEARRVVDEAKGCAACDVAALFGLLVQRRRIDLAREFLPLVSRDAVREDAMVDYDLLQSLAESERSVASELVFGVAHGRAYN